MNKNEFLTNFKKLWIYGKKLKKYYIAFVISYLLIALTGVVVPLISSLMIIKVTNSLWEELIYFSILFLIINCLKSFFSFLANLSSTKFYRKFLLELKKCLIDETFKVKMNVIDQNSSGTFIDRLNKDTEEITQVLTDFSTFITDIFADIGVFITIFIINKIIFLYFFIVVLITMYFRKKQMDLFIIRSKKLKELNEKSTGLISELIRGLKDIRVLNSEESFKSNVYDYINNANEENYQLSLVSRKYNLLVDFLYNITNFIYIILSVILIKNNLFTGTSMIVVYMYKDKIYSLLGVTAKLMEFVKKFNLSSNRIFEIIEGNTFEKESFGNKKLLKATGNFEFKNVNFSYDNKKKVIKNLSFKIKENSTVGFVGESGGGKSTIFSLLTKLYDNYDGKILLDGIEIKDLDKESIRNNMSIITQNPYIFNFSIKNNIKAVKKDASDKEIEDVCKMVCLHDYIMTLPKKYDTIVGEGGVTLSGGQKQRLAIARALIQKTEIILFDEATSALDNDTQEEIQTAIKNMQGEYTILIIAHRLSTIKDCDKLIIIKDGENIGEGTFNYLMKNNEYFKNLYNKEIKQE